MFIIIDIKMRIFSYEKYKEWCKKRGALEYNWAKKCDGLAVGDDNYIIGTFFQSGRQWEVEKYGRKQNG